MYIPPFQVTDQPAEADWQFLEERINRFNIDTTGYDDYRPLAIFVCDDTDALIAGITAFT